MTCKKCGKEFEGKFCPLCGTKVNMDIRQKKPSKKTFTVLIILILAIVLVAVSVLLILKYNGKKSGLNKDIGEIIYSPTEAEHIETAENSEMYVDNEILIVASEKAEYSDIEDLAKKHEAKIAGYIEITGDYQLRLENSCTKEELDGLVDLLLESDFVESACINYATYIGDEKTEERNGFYYGDEWENDLQNFNNCQGKSWGIEAIEVLASWDILDANKSKIEPIKVGLIDSGFESTHEDLGFAEVFYETLTKHGTHVAGTMAAKSDNDEGICGVYPYGNNNLYGVSYRGICSYSENGSPISTSMFLKIAYAELILRDVKVINSSLGFNYYKWPISNSGEKWDAQVEFLESNSHILGDYLNRLLEMGYDFVLVNAAGNDSDRENGVVYDSTYNFWTTVISEEDYPDVYNRIIVVGSVDSELNISNFSNGGDRVDIFAPGESIYSTVPGNEYSNNNWNGTSMAAPHVAGVAASVWSVNRNLTGAQVKEIVCSNHSFRCNSCDMVDAYMAVQQAAQMNTSDNGNNSKNGGILSWVVSASDVNLKINGATVTVNNNETGDEFSATTDSMGHFELFVPEGIYTLTVIAEGYDDFTLTDPVTVENNSVNYLNDWIKLKSENKTDNLLSQINYYDSTGKQIYRENYTYYDNGLLCSTTLFSVDFMADGTPFYGGIYTFLYLYDKNGNLTDKVFGGLNISEWHNDSTGEITLGYEYDSNGNSTKIYFYPEKESIEQAKFKVDPSKTEKVYGNSSVVLTDVSENWVDTYLGSIFSKEPESDMCECRLIYVNDDSVPELWMDFVSGAGGDEIYTQSNGITDRIYISHGTAQWIEKNNILITSGGHMDVYSDKVYKIENGKFITIASGDYGAENNSRVQLDENGYPIYDYYWNDVKMSESEYNDKLNSFFDRSMSVDIYQNVYTFKQCKLLLKFLLSNSKEDTDIPGTGEDISSEVLDEIIDMVEKTEYVWHNSEDYNFKYMPVSQIIDNVILAWPYYEYGLYYYYGFAPYEVMSDPENKFNGYAVKFETNDVLWILNNMFDRDFDYSSGEYHYFHDSELCVRERIGIGGFGYIVNSVNIVGHKPLGDNTYEVIISVKFVDQWGGDPTEKTYEYKFITFIEEDGHNWKIISYERS